MMHVMRRRLVALLVTAALPLSGACGSSSGTSTVAPTPVTTTESFTSTLDQLGSVTNGFTVAAAGTVQVKLTDVEPLTTMALGVAVTTGGSACGSDIAQNTNAKSGTTALSGNAAVGSYCVRVFDAGNIPADTSVTYTVEVTHP
jgi:ABC-type glycerol-3-phosphate transport system substrate-binding protein